MANNSSSTLDSSTSNDVCSIFQPKFDPYNTSRPDYTYHTLMFLGTVNGIASLPTVILNTLIIWVVFGDEQLRSSAFNVFLASLAVTDFLVGLLVEPLFCVLARCVVNHCHSPCQFAVYVLLIVACCGATTVALALACAERYLAIEHPNFYLKNIAGLSGRKVMTATMLFWTATLAFLVSGTALSFIYHPNLTKVPLAVIISVSALVIVYCSIKVQLTAYRQNKTITIQVQSVQQQEQSDEQQQVQQQREERRKEYKRVFTMTMLVVVSVIFYTPFIAVGVVEAMMAEGFMGDFQHFVGVISATFLHLQSLINPIVMSLRLSYIREGIKKKLVCFTGI